MKRKQFLIITQENGLYELSHLNVWFWLVIFEGVKLLNSWKYQRKHFPFMILNMAHFQYYPVLCDKRETFIIKHLIIDLCYMYSIQWEPENCSSVNYKVCIFASELLTGLFRNDETVKISELHTELFRNDETVKTSELHPGLFRNYETVKYLNYMQGYPEMIRL